MDELLVIAAAKGLRVHYLMDLGDGLGWRAILGAGTDMRWRDGDTPVAAMLGAIEAHEPVGYLE